MANVNVDLENAAGKYVFKKFKGVEESMISSDEPYADKCINFRIMADGTLKKRCGFRLQGNLPYTVRTFWDGYVGSVRYCFALSGSYIYNVNYLSNTYTFAGSVKTTGGAAEFFAYNGSLYLIDGDSVYVYKGASFVKTSGYIPLYGDGWSPSQSGKVNEPINCLSPYVRIRYVMNSDADTTYIFPWKVDSVYKIYADGVLRPNDHFSFGSTNQTGMLLTSNLKKGSEIILYLKLSNFETDFSSEVRLCKNSVVYGLADRTKLFLYNCSRARRVYYSRYVDPHALDLLKKQEYSASELYFVDGDYFDVGDTDGGITSMCTYDDKLFIFTGSETWYATCDGAGQQPAVQISNKIGCVSVGAAVSANDGIVTVMATGVYYLYVTGSSKNVFTYKKISDPISDSVRASFFKLASMHYCASRGELWLSKNNSSTDKVWIYDQAGNWICFDGIKSNGFSEVDGDVGFYTGTQIYAFQEALYYDTDYTTAASCEIIATWKSKPIDFGNPERKKKLLWAAFQASAGDEIIELELFGDNGGYDSFELMGSSAKAISTFSCRPHIGRFRYAQVGINTGKRPKLRIVGITLAVSRR